MISQVYVEIVSDSLIITILSSKMYAYLYTYMALFISGTENPADDESRERVAVEKETGGSYVVNIFFFI